MKYTFIQQHQGQFAIHALCRVLGVSRSAYYAWGTRLPSERARDDEEMGVLIAQILIAQIFHQSAGRYGSPRVHQELQAQGIRSGAVRKQ